ncbi:arabinose transporter [Chromobacterium sp. ATCC 53434]|uniref:MFS transporter n=1 Tax=Chromobacterium sp. (strain ATCC 53434 / SC 14030) TaxID=2059672 RepID=UPI000C76299A|nr:MFS transporter [Chromobacterium sp. ATCC 53434]AUH51678.1 arabinose transporter [Chromobacterium sp. ATCC 53434]
MSEVVAFPVAYRRLLAKTAALFLSYLAVAMSLPATSIHVIDTLHFGNAAGGLAVGIAFLSTILTRGYAGRLSDLRGGKACMQRGLCWYALAGLVCLVSARFAAQPGLGLGILLAGRLLLGLGESLAIVGMAAWSIGLMGPAHSGRVMSLVGIGMYGAFAAGGPLGLLLYRHAGFEVLMLVCILLPLAGLALVHRFAPVAPPVGKREPFLRIVGRIGLPGAAVFLQGVGFAGLGAFFALYFSSRGWAWGGLGLTGFGAGFVLVRLGFGHLPDRIGGARVAMLSLAIEACGQALIWLSPNPAGALAGALLTGIGCSMVFPAMGVEVVRRVPAHLRGSALGGFAACQDLAYGLTGPIAGLFADRFGYGAVFLAGMACALLGMAAAASLRVGQAPETDGAAV